MDPTTLPIPPLGEREPEVAGLRAAMFTSNGLAPPTEETGATVYAAANALTEAGLIVDEQTPPDLKEAWEITLQYWHYCDEVGAVAEYFRFLERWDRFRVKMAAFMEDWDLILCPVEAFPAPRLDEEGGPPHFTYTTPFSLLGWPCAAVRAGTSMDGLPIGVQIVGGSWRDDLALAAARAIEGARGGWMPPDLTGEPPRDSGLSTPRC
jgi:amidase